jgi:hypothetical protein
MSLHAGMTVTILGYNDGKYFSANEIDMPYSRVSDGDQGGPPGNVQAPAPYAPLPASAYMMPYYSAAPAYGYGYGVAPGITIAPSFNWVTRGGWGGWHR